MPSCLFRLLCPRHATRVKEYESFRSSLCPRPGQFHGFHSDHLTELTLEVVRGKNFPWKCAMIFFSKKCQGPDSYTISSQRLNGCDHHLEENKGRKQKLIMWCMRSPATQQSSSAVCTDNKKHWNSRFQKESTIIIFQAIGLGKLAIGSNTTECVPCENSSNRIVLQQMLLWQSHAPE